VPDTQRKKSWNADEIKKKFYALPHRSKTPS